MRLGCFAAKNAIYNTAFFASSCRDTMQRLQASAYLAEHTEPSGSCLSQVGNNNKNSFDGGRLKRGWPFSRERSIFIA